MKTRRREATPDSHLVRSMRWGIDNENRIAIELNGKIYTFTRLDEAQALINGMQRQVDDVRALKE